MNIFAKLFAKRVEPKTISLEISSGFQSFNGNSYGNAAFRAAVDTIARHCAKLQAHCSGNGLANEFLENLLTISPNRYYSAYDALYRLATAYFSNNNAFMLIERGGSVGNVTAVYTLTPSSVEFISNDNGELYARMLFPDGKQATFDYADVIHMRRHYSTNELLGADNTPLYAVLDTAETLNQGIAAATKNAVSLKGVLKFTSLVNPVQQKAEKEAFIKDFYNTSNNGGIATTDQRYDFEPVETKAYSIPRETIEAVNAQIYSYLGVSPKIISGEFTENEFQSFYESVIEPFALQMSLEFTRKCRTEVQFTSERLEFASAKTRISLIHEAAPLGILTVNECRKLLALPPIEDGDKTLQSLNYVNAAKADEYQEIESEETE